MKHRYLLIAFWGIMLSVSSHAQMVGDNIFLSGRWLQVAIAPNGSWGNTITAPAGYSTRGGSTTADPVTGTTPAVGIDFSYDQGHDGFTVGTDPYYGSYFLPGTPFDGWSMQFSGHRYDAYYTSYTGWSGVRGFYSSTTDSLSGTVTNYTLQTPDPCLAITSSTAYGTWGGTVGPLRLTQVNRIDTNASWDIVSVKFVNTTDSTVHGCYYFVSADPDNDVLLSGGTYTTDNHICYQGAGNRHEVNAVPDPGPHPLAFSGLATKDCRAKAMIYNGWPPAVSTGNNLDLVWAGTPTGGMCPCYQGLYNTTISQDIAYGLIYNLGDLAPGDSVGFSYAWIFSDSTAIDSAFKDTDPTMQPYLATLGTRHDSLDTVTGCNLTSCGSVGFTFLATIVNGTDGLWSNTEWQWSPAIGLSSTRGTQVSVNIAALSGPTTYTITGVRDGTHNACGYSKTFLLYVTPCFNATNNGPVCITDTLFLSGHGDSTGATYRWFGPGGWTATGQFTYRTGMTMADTGWYVVVKTVAGATDTARTHVSLKPLPVVVATSNSPVCSGNPNVLNLFSTPDSVGETFTWTGPNGFTSTLQNPSRSGPPVADRGTYKVRTVLNGCADSAYVPVIVDTTPATPTASSNSPLCSPKDGTTGSTLMLTASDVTPGVSYSWSGPAGFSSLLQNPTWPIVPTAATGTYTVTVFINSDGITCRNFTTTVVTVDSTPYLPLLASNAPICTGLTLMLNATSSPGSSYSWSGPNGFTSVLQNPSIVAAPTTATGTYSVTATITYPGIPGGCTSDVATLPVVVDSTPVIPTASSNSPGPPSICERDTLFLTASDGTAGVTYYWAGPNSFTSTQQDPFIVNVGAAATGLYTVTATLDSSCSASTVITVSITPTPTLLATNNGPICTGVADTLFLEATSNPGATFSWTGPLVFLSNLQTPYRTPVISEMGGVYQVVAFLNGCSSLPVNDTVVIKRTPPVVWVKDTFFCQYYDAPRLQAFGDSVLWYATNNVNGPATLLPPIPPTASDTVMWFYTTQTVSGCRSAVDSFSVTINPKPVVTVNPSMQICPRDSVVLTATDTDPLITFRWYPPLYLDDTVGASVVSHAVTNVNYHVVTTNQYGCHDTAYTSVFVHSGANLYMEDSVTLYPGETYHIEPQTNCTFFTWTPAAGLDYNNIANPTASPQISTKYIVHAETSWGCKIVDSISIRVDPETLLNLPNAFAPGTGPNNQFKILKKGIATLNYFRIYDRWGVMVFETTDIDQGWDGTYKGAPQPFGVYVYEVSAVTSAGRTFLKHGNVTLVR